MEKFSSDRQFKTSKGKFFKQLIAPSPLNRMHDGDVHFSVLCKMGSSSILTAIRSGFKSTNFFRKAGFLPEKNLGGKTIDHCF